MVPSAREQMCIISFPPLVGVVILLAVTSKVPAPEVAGFSVEVVPLPRLTDATPRANCPEMLASPFTEREPVT